MQRKRVYTPHPDRQSNKVENSDSKSDCLISELHQRKVTVLPPNDSMGSEQEDEDTMCHDTDPQGLNLRASTGDSTNVASQVGFLLHKYDEISNLSSSRLRSKLQFSAQQFNTAQKSRTEEDIESSSETLFCPYCPLNSADDVLELCVSCLSAELKEGSRAEFCVSHHPLKYQLSSVGKGTAKLSTDCDTNFKSFKERRKRQIQTKLLAVVLEHSLPVRSYCSSAQLFRMLHKTQAQPEDQNLDLEDHLKIGRESLSPFEAENLIFPSHTLPCSLCQEKCNALIRSLTMNQPKQFCITGMFQFVIDSILEKVPHITVIIQIVGSTSEYNMTVFLSLYKLSVQGVHLTTTFIGLGARGIFDFFRHVNPCFAVDAAVRTTEVLASSMQSVAEGTIAASAAIQHYFPSGGGAAPYHHAGVAGVSPTRSFLGKIPGVVHMARGRGDDLTNKVLSDRLYRKLSKIDSTSKVISYLERHDEVLTSRQKQRVQRMMHYEISLRPFVATVIAPMVQTQQNGTSINIKSSSATEFSSLLPRTINENNDTAPPLAQRHNSFSNHDWTEGEKTDVKNGSHDLSSRGSSPSGESESIDGNSPFLCTPKSFPPTPWSRSMVLARGSSAAEDVVFFAREHLRVEDALTSSNEKTRSMAMALREGKRLAVFNADHASSGIELSSGQHCATKVGNELYCTARCMVPVLKNCFVYFEMSVWNPTDQASMPPLLSIGLSTLEMPTNHLVGSWKSSVALLSTGKFIPDM